MPKRETFLDPLLHGALQMEQRPIIPSRMDMQRQCESLVVVVEAIGAKASIEGDQQASQQLLNIGESLGACIISLMAYTRGLSPKVSSQKPNANIILDH